MFRRCAWVTLLLVWAILATGCGGSSSETGTASVTSAPNTASLALNLDFGSSKVTGKLSDAITSYTIQIFTLQGELLATRGGTRGPGSGPVTVVVTGLPVGVPVIARFIGLDGAGVILGYQDLPAVTGTTVALTFDSLTPGPPPASCA